MRQCLNLIPLMVFYLKLFPAPDASGRLYLFPDVSGRYEDTASPDNYRDRARALYFETQFSNY